MKQYFLLSSFVIVMIMALPLFWLKLMQWAFLDDTAIIAEGISLVGAILGGTISGALTLIGVRLTINQQTKAFERKEEKFAEEKYNQAQYIKTEVFGLIIGVQTAIKSLNKSNFEVQLQRVYDAANKLEEAARKVMPQSADVGSTLLMCLRDITWATDDIKEFIDEAQDQDFEPAWVMNQLINGRYYQRIAIADVLFIDTINSFDIRKIV